MKSIFETTLAEIKLQPTWMYEVEFIFGDKTVNGVSIKNYSEQKLLLNPISISLPQIEILTKDVYYGGKKKTVKVFTNTSGDLNAEFIMSKQAMKFLFGDFTGKSAMAELSTTIPRMDICLYNAKGEKSYTYFIYEPLITAVEHSESVSYESEDQIKLSVTIHYNAWDYACYG